NEWIAGKWRYNSKDDSHALFVDQASPEYSRDLEPSLTGGLRDHYYMQLVANIRRYKGMSATPMIIKRKRASVKVDWNKEADVYHDYTGDILHRNHPGASSKPKIMYQNTSGRNDLHKLKVVAGRDRIYFLATTFNKLSPIDGDNWMTLWLNTDSSYQSGWLGYDYRVINGHQLQRYVGDSWQAAGTVKRQVGDNQLVVELPYRLLGLPAGDFPIELKWTDNMQDNDPLDWYVNGDAAPGGRFNLLLHVK
ncbi:MAG TPA: hypothetical protein VL943_09735, partial [Niabella sp.]|nr:hypothetical protein [Niabella sp.]